MIPVVKQLLLIVVPTLMIVVGVVSFVHWIWRYLASVRVPGTVKRHQEGLDSDGDKVIQLVVSFQAYDQDWEFVDPMSGVSTPKIGATVEVFFLPGQAHKAQVCRFIHPMIMATIALTGLVTLIVGINRL